MKLYMFITPSWSKPPKLKVEEFEVEEKPKTYVCKGRRFSKEDIGHVSGYDLTNVFCLKTIRQRLAKFF